jgi:hypothetical protein
MVMTQYMKIPMVGTASGKKQTDTIQGICGFTTGHSSSDVPLKRTQEFKQAKVKDKLKHEKPLAMTSREKGLVANAESKSLYSPCRDILPVHESMHMLHKLRKGEVDGSI